MLIYARFANSWFKCGNNRTRPGATRRRIPGNFADSFRRPQWTTNGRLDGKSPWNAINQKVSRQTMGD